LEVGRKRGESASSEGKATLRNERAGKFSRLRGGIRYLIEGDERKKVKRISLFERRRKMDLSTCCEERGGRYPILPAGKRSCRHGRKKIFCRGRRGLTPERGSYLFS